MTTYAVHFRRDYNTSNDYSVVVAGLTSLVQARLARQVSGDLVIDEGTGRVVLNEFWLWGWERKNANAYAARAIAYERELQRKIAYSCGDEHAQPLG